MHATQLMLKCIDSANITNHAFTLFVIFGPSSLPTPEERKKTKDLHYMRTTDRTDNYWWKPKNEKHPPRSNRYWEKRFIRRIHYLTTVSLPTPGGLSFHMCVWSVNLKPVKIFKFSTENRNRTAESCG